MLTAIAQGIGLGLLMCVLVGPVFFAIISIALHYSKRAAIRFAVGTSLSDTTFAAIVFASVGAIHLSSTVRRWMGICGGIVFAIMGALMLIRTMKHNKEQAAEVHLKKHPHALSFVSQGFLTNALNPSVILFWATAVSSSVATLSTKLHIAVLIITTLIVFFSTDLLKVYLAEKLKKMLNHTVLYRLHIITGGILIAIGIVVMIKTLFMGHP